MDRAYNMLSVCIRFAPTGKEQGAFAKIYSESKAEGSTEERVVIALASALLDGLCYGNWPGEKANG